MIVDKQTNYMRIVIFILFFTILTPDIKLGSAPAFRFEQVLLLLTVTLILFSILMKKEVVLYYSSLIKIYVLFPFFIFTSTLVGSINGYPPILNDYFEIYKVILYIIAFLISAMILDNRRKIVILKYAVLFITISSIIAFTQYINLFGLNQIYIPNIAPTQYRSLMPGYPTPRVVGMSSNPNVYAIIAALGFVLSLWLLLETRKKFFIATMIITLIANLMTLSRSGFVFLIIVSVLLIVINLYEKGLNFHLIKTMRIKKSVLILMFISLLFCIIMLYSILNFVPEDLTWRLQKILDLSSDNSWNARLEGWDEKIKYFFLSPLFGIGPGKAYLTEASDNEWIFLLSRYGIFGTIVLLLSFIAPIFIKWKGKENFKAIYVPILIGSAIYMVPSAIYHSFQLMTLIMVLFGIMLPTKKIIIKGKKI